MVLLCRYLMWVGGPSSDPHRCATHHYLLCITGTTPVHPRAGLVEFEWLFVPVAFVAAKGRLRTYLGS